MNRQVRDRGTGMRLTERTDRQNYDSEDRASIAASRGKNLVKIARVVPEISSRTDRHTHHNTSQHKKTKARFSCLVRPPAWKRSSLYSIAPWARTGRRVIEIMTCRVPYSSQNNSCSVCRRVEQAVTRCYWSTDSERLQKQAERTLKRYGRLQLTGYIANQPQTWNKINVLLLLDVHCVPKKLDH